jgi:hypothetical protein
MNVDLRYYWESIFSVEYFPYWEFSMLMILFLLVRVILRLDNLDKKLN